MTQTTAGFRVDPALTGRDDVDLIAGADVKIGDTLVYPCWLDRQVNGSNVAHLPCTVASIVEYPESRVLYWVNPDQRPGLYGLVDRRGTVGRLR